MKRPVFAEKKNENALSFWRSAHIHRIVWHFYKNFFLWWMDSVLFLKSSFPFFKLAVRHSDTHNTLVPVISLSFGEIMN